MLNPELDAFSNGDDYLQTTKLKQNYVDKTVDVSLVGASFDVDDSSVFRMRCHGC
jgi:hypothetical protein